MATYSLITYSLWTFEELKNYLAKVKAWRCNEELKLLLFLMASKEPAVSVHQLAHQ